MHSHILDSQTIAASLTDHLGSHRLTEAKAIVEREMWLVEDLKKMSDPKSRLY